MPRPKSSKIGKVMRHIAALSPEKLPRDSEFSFKQRAKVPVDRWQEVLNASKSNGTDDAVTAEANGPVGDEDNKMQVEGEATSAAPPTEPTAIGETTAEILMSAA
jgi:hypothetical protein